MRNNIINVLLTCESLGIDTLVKSDQIN